jgi:hypothetical protein
MSFFDIEDNILQKPGKENSVFTTNGRKFCRSRDQTLVCEPLT